MSADLRRVGGTLRCASPTQPRTTATTGAGRVLFFGARITLGTILGRFSINYFSGLGLRIRVRVWVRVRVRVGVRVSVVIWSG